jgi:hypothetical protein
MKRYYGYDTKVYAAELEGHDVAIEFDKALVVINRARLYIDAVEVDRTKVWYGDKRLEATTDDGVEVVVEIDSGMVGELTRAQLRHPDGSWVDLQERAPQPR